MIIIPKKLTGEISAPPSKSYLQRAVLAAALSEGVSVINNALLSDDVMAAIKAARSLGAKVDILNSENKIASLNIEGIDGKAHDITPHIDCGESGAMLRFMIPICSVCFGDGVFIAKGSLAKRPIKVYEDIFKQQGLIWELRNSGTDVQIKTSGKIRSGQYNIPGNISSQYISGLLFALPMLKGDSQITVTSNLESAAYVDMTVDMLERFGVRIDKSGETYIIKGGQKYTSAKYDAEGDWSQAAFFITAGILGDVVKIHGLNTDSKQADKAIIEIFKNMGGDITAADSTITARKSKLRAIQVDVSQCPDIAPAIAVAMAFSEGESRIFGGTRLKIKESDRLMSIVETLKALGADIAATDDGMIIHGGHGLHGASIDSFSDHRIAMMTACVSQMCDGEIKLSDAECTNKSYPSFWEDFVSLGGEIK